MDRRFALLAVVIVIALLATALTASGDQRHDAAVSDAALPAAPLPPPSNPQRDAYFGDLHLHSGFSADAFALGTRLTPEDAHRWARGDAIDYLGRTIRRKAPLDFLALTDHAEYLGVMPEAADPRGAFAGSEWTAALGDADPKARGALFRKLVQATAANERIPAFEKPEVLRSIWQRYAAVADKYDEPGKFTAFVAFEWTSAPGNQNLHRCVIFRGRGPAAPFTSLDSLDPEDLWRFLEKERAEGREVIAIPHNGNVSNGLMFDARKTYAGAPITREYARRRMANEPLFEITQEKGSSDTHPRLSPGDAFADFETYNFLLGSRTVAKFTTGSYLRQAYGAGQEIEARIGVNPFKYGIEGGTDNHAGMSATEEFNFHGPNGGITDRRAALQRVAEDTPVYNNPGGLTGVWAERNTRDAIFDALRRKETFGTSGGRIKVRFFGGWDYPADLPSREGWVSAAYAGGVPMGSDLPARPRGRVPTFVIQAVKDPDGGNLDLVQIIKVTTSAGRSREDVIDVLWSGGRVREAKTGRVPDVGNTVDVASAAYTNTIGAVELAGTWTDTAFDPHARITYYVRVIEIPTPRWSTYWAAEAGIAPSERMPPIVRERAWTSPIWYVPPG